MYGTLLGAITVFGWGVVYFIGAIPFGVFVLKLNPVLTAFSAWAGYSAIAAAMIVINDSARTWIVRKLHIPAEPNPEKLFWRVWLRYGLPGLALLAPVTIGPYTAAIIATLLGVKWQRWLPWIAFSAVPYCVVFAILCAYFPGLFQKTS